MEKRRRFGTDEVVITHVRGSGPGGQNRNKRWTGVRIEHLPTGIVSIATERRSQGQNLSAALDRLDEKLEKHYFRPTPRVDTRPTRASKERRITGKKKASVRKQARGRVRRFDE